MNTLVRMGLDHHQDFPQTGSKLYYVTNIDIEKIFLTVYCFVFFYI